MNASVQALLQLDLWALYKSSGVQVLLLLQTLRIKANLIIFINFLPIKINLSA